jgi:hypothetical protein
MTIIYPTASREPWPKSEEGHFLKYFFGGLECVGHSFAKVAYFVFLSDVWILTQRAALASRRATNLATHLPEFAHLPEGNWGKYYLVFTNSPLDVVELVCVAPVTHNNAALGADLVPCTVVLYERGIRVVLARHFRGHFYPLSETHCLNLFTSSVKSYENV